MRYRSGPRDLPGPWAGRLLVELAIVAGVADEVDPQQPTRRIERFRIAARIILSIREQRHVRLEGHAKGAGRDRSLRALAILRHLEGRDLPAALDVRLRPRLDLRR